MNWFDKNNYLVCPNCHKSEGVGLVWSGGNTYFGNREEDFVCELCECEFTGVYKMVDIKITQEGKKQND